MRIVYSVHLHCALSAGLRGRDLCRAPSLLLMVLFHTHSPGSCPTHYTVCDTAGALCFRFWNNVLWLQMGKMNHHVIFCSKGPSGLCNSIALFKQMVCFKFWSDTLQVSSEVLDAGCHSRKANVTLSLLTVGAVSQAFYMSFSRWIYHSTHVHVYVYVRPLEAGAQEEKETWHKKWNSFMQLNIKLCLVWWWYMNNNSVSKTSCFLFINVTHIYHFVLITSFCKTKKPKTNLFPPKVTRD